MKRLCYVALGVAIGCVLAGSGTVSATLERLVVQASPQHFFVDGNAVDLEAYNINGYNYVKLGDLSPLVGFPLSYDAETNSVYIGEQPQREEAPQPAQMEEQRQGEETDGGEEVKLTLAERGKDNEKYPTVGHADSPNKNGYFTKANVDLGVARLEYEFLDLVNEARVKEGHAPLIWAPYDEMEEYTLLRAKELTHDFSHGRPTDLPGVYSSTAFGHGVIAGGGSVKNVFDAWMNSPGHKRTLMNDDATFMCAARCYGEWIIELGSKWTLDTSVYSAPNNYNIGDPVT